MAREFECERDKVVIRGENDDELITNVERHVARFHPDLEGSVTRDDILAATQET